MDREMHGGAHQDFGPTWQRVRHRLRREVGENTYRSWFKSLHLEQVTSGRAVMSLQSRTLSTKRFLQYSATKFIPLSVILQQPLMSRATRLGE